MSWNSVALYLGIAFGPGVGQVLLGWGGFDAAWIGGAALALIAVLLVLRVPETAPPAPEGAAKTPLIHRSVIRPGLALFAGVAATSGFLALVGLRSTEMGFRALEARPAGLWRHCGGLPNRVRPGTRSAASVASWGRLVDGLHRRPIHFEFDP